MADARSQAEELLDLGAATVGESGAMTMGSNVRPAWSGARVCGPALTVRCEPGDNLAVHVAVARSSDGCVLVVSVGEEEERGYWGEVLTTGAMSHGVKGLVIGGGVRDVSALESHGFPVFSTMIALKGAAKTAGGEVGGLVEVGGVSVRTGDWIVGDSDGVAVISERTLDDVISAARARAVKESAMFAELRAGRTTLELLGLDTKAVEIADGTPSAGV